MKRVKAKIRMPPSEEHSEDAFENPGNHANDGPEDSCDDADQPTHQAKEQTDQPTRQSNPNREGEEHKDHNQNSGGAAHNFEIYNQSIRKNHSTILRR